MAMFTVVKIVDGDTFDVNPAWQWNGESGKRVRPAGYDAAELGTRGAITATRRLSGLILGKKVRLGTAHRVDRGRLVCEVYCSNGHNLKEYFN